MSYTMNEAVAVGKQATADITFWLRGLSQTVKIENVEDDPNFQRLDVDLIWTTHKGRYQIEVKGDRYHKTGNFFLETHSNKEKGTPGCFMYTQADLLFYYFVVPRTLYILPVPATRPWFQARIDQFRQRSTTTPVGNRYYTTVGRLVPIKTVIEEIPTVTRYQLPE